MLPVPLPSFKRQRLLLEYAAIKSKCPDGIYLLPNAADPALWSGVFFVRNGPYASAVLRFDITLPSPYPDGPPSINFSTETFHPLLVPLTTYTFAAGALDPNATVSSGEAERLPPGSFYLREGFPHWRRETRSPSMSGSLLSPAQETSSTTNAADQDLQDKPRPQSLESVLSYMKEAFEDASFLDNLPLRAAVNINAWHAWRAYRGLPKLGSRSISPASADSGRTPRSPGRTPGDWNWEGVWESRVRNGIEESMSDASLFGSKGNRSIVSTGGPIRFAKIDDEKLLEVQSAMSRALGLSST